jgi:hypothetical protein
MSAKPFASKVTGDLGEFQPRAQVCGASPASTVLSRGNVIPSPHPLDFDWRFDEPTVERLVHALDGSHGVLALGTPSVARRLEVNRADLLLVDRQPVQGVSNHLVIDIPSLRFVERGFEIAIADPPWYPAEMISWATVGGRLLGVGGKVLISAWPGSTRPNASEELSRALTAISEWADVEDANFPLDYAAPHFEQIASSIAPGASLAISPRRGRLLKLTVRRSPQQPVIEPRKSTWHRFVVDDYQLAIRLAAETGESRLVIQHPDAKAWLWPYVSLRAPRSEMIGIWSSENEVGLVSRPAQLISLLRETFNARDSNAFEESLAQVPELLAWQLPRPPHDRVLEWQHP